MKIELYIEGKKKIFTAPIIPMMAKRKFLALQSRDEVDLNDMTEDQLDEMYSILSDIVFKNQFTLTDLYEGAEENYLMSKMTEVITGKPAPKDVEGNGKKTKA